MRATKTFCLLAALGVGLCAIAQDSGEPTSYLADVRVLRILDGRVLEDSPLTENAPPFARPLEENPTPALPGLFTVGTLSAPLTVGNYELRLDGAVVEREDIPEPQEPEVVLIAETSLQAAPRERTELRVRDTLPEYFEPAGDDKPGLFEHKFSDRAPGYHFAFKVTPADERYVNVEWVCKMTFLGARRKLEGVSLDVGRPTFDLRETESAIDLPLGKWSYILQEIGDEGHMLTLIRVREAPEEEKLATRYNPDAASYEYDIDGDGSPETIPYYTRPKDVASSETPSYANTTYRVHARTFLISLVENEAAMERFVIDSTQQPVFGEAQVFRAVKPLSDGTKLESMENVVTWLDQHAEHKGPPWSRLVSASEGQPSAKADGLRDKVHEDTKTTRLHFPALARMHEEMWGEMFDPQDPSWTIARLLPYAVRVTPSAKQGWIDVDFAYAELSAIDKTIPGTWYRKGTVEQSVEAHRFRHEFSVRDGGWVGFICATAFPDYRTVTLLKLDDVTDEIPWQYHAEVKFLRFPEGNLEDAIRLLQLVPDKDATISNKVHVFRATVDGRIPKDFYQDLLADLRSQCDAELLSAPAVTTMSADAIRARRARRQNDGHTTDATGARTPRHQDDRHTGGNSDDTFLTAAQRARVVERFDRILLDVRDMFDCPQEERLDGLAVIWDVLAGPPDSPVEDESLGTIVALIINSSSRPGEAAVDFAFRHRYHVETGRRGWFRRKEPPALAEMQFRHKFLLGETEIIAFAYPEDVGNAHHLILLTVEGVCSGGLRPQPGYHSDLDGDGEVDEASFQDAAPNDADVETEADTE
ncbi:MAG TPA: hypothetical protein HPP83_12305 [Candidatus Hydrogenedentes bacterium]|nr:hypothetical protein [Candidatus Hydrogenedentota bacterium]